MLNESAVSRAVTANKSNIEKEGISLMMMNKDLGGIVLVDRDKVKSQYLKRQQ